MAEETLAEEPQTEDQLVIRAQEALSSCNWVIGECASEWTQKYARGRTDADFGSMIGLSGDQVYQRRRVWETFADVNTDYTNLKWSHFYVALNWDDASECLQWANEIEATVAEMKAWRRSQHGEDLTAPAEEEAPFSIAPDYLQVGDNMVREVADVEGEGRSLAGAGVGSSGERAETVNSAPRESSGNSEYAPFGQGARGDASSDENEKREGPSSEEIYKRACASIEKVVVALSPELIEDFREMPLELQQRFVNAVKNLQSRTAGLS
ncbi:hypothetical protein [Thalassoglobus polymorphus]|uniref:Uncharacterized protein n=1 Tax=Thalassoglobus polymorphus TaxID=2527994 RepID=A0A517QI68_9PLAN|nr:hypothetical protein [Thalassoglobus polymorphus]QDT31333.1 hypothetical protein Mal48_05660 [Thalassoglobus polymorphus]